MRELLALLEAGQRGRAEELAEELGVHRATVYRLLELAADTAGFGVGAEWDAKRGLYRVVDWGIINPERLRGNG